MSDCKHDKLRPRYFDYPCIACAVCEEEIRAEEMIDRLEKAEALIGKLKATFRWQAGGLYYHCPNCNAMRDNVKIIRKHREDCILKDILTGEGEE